MGANKEQLEAINCTDRTILCLAAAGSGKTYCLVNRVSRLINEGVDPRSILVLTFTNAAAFEMGERFKLANPTCRNIPEFRTFHSFAYSLLVRDGAVRTALKYTKIPDICDDAAFKQIQTEAKLQLNTKLSLEDLQGEKDPAWNSKMKHEYDSFQMLVLKLMRKQGVITFDLLNTKLGELFAAKEPCILKYHEQYKHVLIDEFQDCDPNQMRFLGSFPSTTNIFCVGDALQCIYQFRNCSNRYIKMLATDSNWTHIKLFENYRSTNQICKFANKMSHYADPEYRIEMKGQRDGDEVEVIYGANSNYIEIVDNEHMHKLVQKLKISDEGGAVLCRTNKEVNYVKDRLKQEKISFVSKSQDNSEAINILKSASDQKFGVYWVASKLTAGNYAHFVRMTQVKPVSLKELQEAFANDADVVKLAQKIIDIHNCMKVDTMTTSNKFSTILQILDVFVPPVPEDITDETLLKYISENIQEQADAQLYVGTIHSSKGLEYTHVYLMGVDDRSFPVDSEDMKNLLYVGITRAKSHLTVFRR